MTQATRSPAGPGGPTPKRHEAGPRHPATRRRRAGDTRRQVAPPRKQSFLHRREPPRAAPLQARPGPQQPPARVKRWWLRSASTAAPWEGLVEAGRVELNVRILCARRVGGVPRRMGHCHLVAAGRHRRRRRLRRAELATRAVHFAPSCSAAPFPARIITACPRGGPIAAPRGGGRAVSAPGEVRDGPAGRLRCPWRA